MLVVCFPLSAGATTQSDVSAEYSLSKSQYEPGEISTIKMEIQNQGSSEYDEDLKLTFVKDIPGDWKAVAVSGEKASRTPALASFEDWRVPRWKWDFSSDKSLKPNEHVSATLKLEIPDNADEGTYRIPVRFTHSDGVRTLLIRIPVNIPENSQSGGGGQEMMK
jgi:uncharacterized membrane protein